LVRGVRGARDAGGAWRLWAPPPNEGAARAAAWGTTGLWLMRRPLQTLRWASEPRRRRRQRRERGKKPLAQMQPAVSPEGNRLQTWARDEGGGARLLRTRKAAGSERDRALL
jgi:hypothetical protein